MVNQKFINCLNDVGKFNFEIFLKVCKIIILCSQIEIYAISCTKNIELQNVCA